MGKSQKDRVPELTADEIRAILTGMEPARKEQLVARIKAEQEARRTAWRCTFTGCSGDPHESMPVRHARNNQLFDHVPGTAGTIWMAGRGFGKTRTGAEAVRERVLSGKARKIALIARTAADVRDVMVEGESGILNVFPKWQKPTYIPSQRKVVFHNGAVATGYSSETPDQLRGSNNDMVWVDEFSALKRPHETMYNAQMTLRVGDPVMLMTGTPRPTPFVKKVLAGGYANFHIVRGTTYENLGNLAPIFHDVIVAQFEGTRTGRQELNGEMLEDIEGALLKISDFEHSDFRPGTDENGQIKLRSRMSRIVVAVDPAVTAETSSDYTGIAVCATDDAGQYGYVLWSEQMKAEPIRCMERVSELYEQYAANYVVAEVNQGGNYVKTALRQIDPDIPIKTVHASKSKYARAEPVAGLYQQKRISHVGHHSIHAALETEWTSWVPPGTRDAEGAIIPQGESPDVMDAVVWGFTDLMLKRSHTRPSRPTRSVST